MTAVLSPSQNAALFDILTHYDTYAEIRAFRHPGSLAHYGPPFTHDAGRPSTSPALQCLVSRFLLTLPGLRSLPEKWWTVQCDDIIEQLEKANLSESYDKGVIGSRKTVATAFAALIEYPVRGTYGGVRDLGPAAPHYDHTDAHDLARGFRDFMNEVIYGDALEQLVRRIAETDDLLDHTPLTQAVHEFVLVNLASFMHYILILSPKGQYLLKLVDNANKLVPYLVIKQTLKIGNVASMINALVKVGLAKVSVASVTNWIGLTQTQDEGMNLMQTIISTVLHWDIRELENRGAKIEKERGGLPKDVIPVLKDYPTKPPREQEEIRRDSQTRSVSIVSAILTHARTPTGADWPDAQHQQALEYLAIQLSIRDRRQLIRCLCKATPDHLTQSVREVVDAYEPVIRRMHQAVDLSATVADFEHFLRDLIKLARLHPDKAGRSPVPTVGDFVQLLRKHQRSSHVFLHQCCKNDEELTGWYLTWAREAAAHFKRDNDPDPDPDADADRDPQTDAPDSRRPQPGAGNLTVALNALFQTLPADRRAAIVPILDAHSAYLEQMHRQSVARLAQVLQSPPSKNPAIAKILFAPSSRSSSRQASPAPPVDRSLTSTPTPTPSDTSRGGKDYPTPRVSSSPGPGSFLARWQALLDATPITPLTPTGAVAAASSPEVVHASATDVDGSAMIQLGAQDARGAKIRVEDNLEHNTTAPGDARRRQKELQLIVDALGRPFRDLLADKSCYW